VFVPKWIDEAIRRGFDAGKSRSRIARELGVSFDVISRRARQLGFPAGAGPGSKFDWRAIAAFYAEGHSAEVCRKRFGISRGSWDRAILRGDLVQRGEAAPGRSHESVRELLQRGLTQAETARRLGLSKSTVAFHARRIGLPPDSRFSRRYDWSEIQRAYDSGLSVRQCAARFGFAHSTWHKAVKRGEVVPRPIEMSIEKLLQNGVKRGRGHLKRRLIKAGLKENRCEICGTTEWLGKPLNMELHHVNGDGTDNRLENLQLLCGNCHSQTDNWGGRGARGKPFRAGS
jgi:transposase-like protein